MLSDIIKTFEDRAILEGGGTPMKPVQGATPELKLNEVVLNKGSLDRYKKTPYGGYLSHFRCNGNTKGVLLIDRSILVGAVNVEKKPDGITWIQALEVNSNYQKKGVGTRLVKRAIDMGATNLSVEKGNAEAIHMYKNAGFKGYKDTGNQYFMSIKNMGTEIPIRDTIAETKKPAVVQKESVNLTPLDRLTESVEITPKGDTIINLQNFENGLFNFILVIGLPGSGKGCFGREVSAKYGGKHLELDVFDQCGNMSDMEIRKVGEPFATYILDTPEGQWYRRNFKTLSVNEKIQGNHDFILYAIGYAKAHKDQIFILDGTPIYAAMEPSEIKNYPLVMKGTDAEDSFQNKVGRDLGKGSSDKLHSNVSKNDLDGLLNYYWNDWGYLNRFKNDVADKADKDTQELTQEEWETKNFNEAGKSLNLQDVKRECEKLNKKLNSYGYGLVMNGKLVDFKEDPREFANLYRTMSCKEFTQYRGGICWDYARFQKSFLNHIGLPAENYYIEIHNTQSSTHTFTVIPVEHQYVYLESSFLKIQGVYVAKSIDIIIQYILQSMGYDPIKEAVDIRSYTDPKPGLTTLQFMDYCMHHGMKKYFSYSKDNTVKNYKGILCYHKK